MSAPLGWVRYLFRRFLYTDQHLKDPSVRRSRVTLLLRLRTLKDRIPGVVVRSVAKRLHVKARWTPEVTVRLLMIARRISEGKVKSKAGAVERAGLLVAAHDVDATVGSGCRQAGGNVIAEHMDAIVKGTLFNDSRILRAQKSTLRPRSVRSRQSLVECETGKS